MLCGNCRNCPAYGAEWGCTGCAGCGVPFLRERRCAHPGGCAGCPYRCPDKPLVWREVAEELGETLSLLSGNLPRLPGVALPPYVPLVTAPLQEGPPDVVEWFAVHGGKVRRAVWRGEIDVREQFNLPPRSKVALHLFVKDGYLDAFWKGRREKYPALRQFDAVFAPNFSVYEDAPRLEHLFNMRRAAVCIAEMAAAGAPVVPDVSWYCREDIERWAEFAAACGAGWVAFSFQSVGRELKGGSYWRSLLFGLRFLAGRLPAGVGIALVGVASPERVREAALAAAGRPLCVVDTKSFVTARKGGVIVRGKKLRAPRGMSRDAAFFASASDLRREIGTIFGFQRDPHA